jgi:hypothetical protein
MRDLFKIFVRKQENQESLFGAIKKRSKGKLVANLVSKDEGLIPFVEKTIQFFLNAEVSHVNLEQEFVKPCQIIVLDLDQVEPSLWSKFVAAKNKDPELRLLIILFNPALQLESVTKTLEKLEQSEKLWILKKPIDLARFYESLSSLKK